MAFIKPDFQGTDLEKRLVDVQEQELPTPFFDDAAIDALRNDNYGAALFQAIKDNETFAKSQGENWGKVTQKLFSNMITKVPNLELPDNIDIPLPLGAIIPSGAVGETIKTVGGDILDIVQMAGDLLDKNSGISPEVFKDRMIQMGISTAVNLLGTIPVVGAIAQSIAGLVMTLVDVFNKPKPKVPPQLKLVPEASINADAGLQRSLYEIYSGVDDWTDLLMPQGGDNFFAVAAKKNQADKGQNAVIIESTVSTAGNRGPRISYVPGTQIILGNFFAQGYNIGGSDVYISSQQTGDFYPQTTNAITALINNVNGEGAGLYTIDVKAIRWAWKNHCDAALAWADEMLGGKWKENPGLKNISKWDDFKGGVFKGKTIDRVDGEPAEWVLESFKHLYMPGKVIDQKSPLYGKYIMNGGPLAGERKNLFDAIINPWLNEIEARQIWMLRNSLTAAYVRAGQPAFNNPLSRGELERMRTELLRHDSRFQVKLDDVRETNYRQKLMASGVNRWQVTGKLAGYPSPTGNAPKGTPPTPPPPPGVGAWPIPELGTGSSNGSGAGAGIAAALIVGLVVFGMMNSQKK
jgi:hypothetical protein